ncbi:hypothetical protein IAT38_005804 [Cryptococcus sp. DSM 104549]
MPPRDILGGRPARPDTPLLAHWTLALPRPDTPIHIRRYQALAPTPAASASTQHLQPNPPVPPQSAPQLNPADPLADPVEAFWRHLAESGSPTGGAGAGGDGGAIEKLLEVPCGIVVAEAGSARQLWSFSIAEDAADTPGDLQEMLPRLPPIYPSQLLTCPQHGQRLACLARPADGDSSPACSVTVNPTGPVRKDWGLLAGALVEKMAWRQGARVFMQASRITGTPPPAIATLHPLTPLSLLLTLRPLTPPPSPPTYTLSPLSLPALLLGPCRPTPQQAAALHAGFDTLLGPAWKACKDDRRLRAQITSAPTLETETEWSIFWVPVTLQGEPLGMSARRWGKMSERQAAEIYQGGEGVVTVWPGHLVEAPPRGAGASGVGVGAWSQSQAQVNADPTPNPEPSDLMSTASSLFDFLATWREPDPVTAGEDDDDDDDDDGEGDVEMDGDSIAEGAGAGAAAGGHLGEANASATVTAGPAETTDPADPDAGSDLDDLFSDGSGSSPSSPRPAPELGDLVQVVDPATSPSQPTLDSAPGADPKQSGLEALQALAPANAGTAPGTGTTSRAEDGGKEGFGIGMVTEDDFAFFDSPGMDWGGGGGEAGDGGEGGEGEDVEMAGGDGGELGGGDEGGVVLGVTAVEGQEGTVIGEGGHGAEGKEGGDVGMDVDGAEQVGVAGSNAVGDTSAVLPSPKAPSHSPSHQSVPSDPSLSPTVHQPHPLPTPPPAPQPPAPRHQPLIPPSFAPLTLPPPSRTPYPYSLPSPASTPESSLLDRLRPPHPTSSHAGAVTNARRKKSPAYAADWDMSEESDEEEEEEVGYTCPPTPESTWDDDDDDGEGEDGTGDTGSKTGSRAGKSGSGRSGASSGRRGTPSRSVGAEGGNEGEVYWGETRCVSAEWVWLRDGRELDSVKTEWDSTWEALGLEVGSPGARMRRVEGGEVEWERVVKEVLENRGVRGMVLGEEWGTGAGVVVGAVRGRGKGGGGKVRGLAELAEVGVTISHLDQGTTIHPLTQPLINTAFSHNILRLSISSLPYWSELGLEPAGGKKDVHALVVCEDTDVARRAASKLMGDMGRAYGDNRLGKHEAGEMGMAVGGVVSVPLEVFAEAVASIASQSFSTPTIIYVLLPTSPPLTLLSSILSVSSPPSTLIHPLPLPTPISPLDPAALSKEIYDRLTRPIHPIHTRGHPADDPERYLPHPRWTLARAEAPKPEFVMSWPVRNWDVLARWKMVHVGYGVVLPEAGEDVDRGKTLKARMAAGAASSGAGGNGAVSDSPQIRRAAVVAFAMDTAGEAWEVKVWRDETDDDSWESRVEKLCEWGRKVARGWATEWRLSVCKMGLMGDGELQAWKLLLSGRPWPITLLMVDSTPPPASGPAPPRPRPVANITPALLTDPTTRLIDNSLSAHLTTFPIRLPVLLPPSETLAIYPQNSFMLTVAATDGEAHASEMYHVVHHKTPHGRKDREDGICGELGEEYYRLGCVMRGRWGGSGWLDGVRWGMKVIEGA